MTRWTERQVAVALSWLEIQFEIPDRHDWYLMAVAAEVRRTLVKHPDSVQPRHMRLKFGRQAALPRMTAEEATVLAKASLGARLGRKIE